MLYIKLKKDKGIRDNESEIKEKEIKKLLDINQKQSITIDEKIKEKTIELEKKTS